MAKSKKSHAVRPVPKDASSAFAKIAPRLDELRPDEVLRVNVDVPRAVSQVLGALPAIAALRPQIVAQLPKHPIRLLDDLRTFALAALHAYLMAIPVAPGETVVKKLLDETAPLRENLLSDAEALARRGLLDPQAVAEIRSGQGNVDKAADLVALAALLSESWNDIQGKTAATSEEIERAATLGPELLAALGAREAGNDGTTPKPAEAADRRDRAYTLFYQAYDECRRAVAYVRWHEDDADDIAPSLFAGRVTRPAPERPAAPAASPIPGGAGPDAAKPPTG